MATETDPLFTDDLHALEDAIPAPEDTVFSTVATTVAGGGSSTLPNISLVMDPLATDQSIGIVQAADSKAREPGDATTAAFFEAASTDGGGTIDSGLQPYAASGAPTPYSAGGPSDGTAASSYAMHGENYIDSLLMTTKWGGGLGTGATVTYSFGTASSVYVSGYSEPTNAFGEFTAHHKAMTRMALDYFSNVADITFVEVTDSATVAGTLRFARSGDPSTAWAYGPGTSPLNGDVWVGWSSNYDDLSEGTYGFQTIMHEIGHALGLSHPHDAPVVGISANDWVGASIQSYKSYEGATNGYKQDFYPTTPMYNDIAALQYIYGANTTHSDTDTTYSWGAGEQLYETIWDAGGTDTIDWSNQSSGALINLNDGAWSELGPAYTIDYTVWPWVIESRTLMIAENVVIENATGGSGDDTLIGNEVANELTGGAGNDTMTGGLGNDTFLIDTGFGNDTITDFTAGVGSDDVIDLSAFAGLTFTDVMINTADVGGNAVITIDRNSLTLTGVAKSDLAHDDFAGLTLGGIVGTVGADNLDGTAADDVIEGLDGIDWVFGLTGNDTIYGGAGDDRLSGGIGGDTLYGGTDNDGLNGGAGNDVLYGEAGNDALVGGDGNDQLFGGDGGDRLTGGSGDDTLDGGLGDDILEGSGGTNTLSGGDGNDIYLVSGALDTVIENLNEGTDHVVSSVTYGLGNNVEELTLNGAAAIDGTGNALDNAITGNSAANILDGASGDDTIRAGDGDDTLFGGDGVDTLHGDLGNDTLNGGNMGDTLLGGAGNDALYGDAGNDYVMGGDGTDTLSGGAGDDLLNGGGGDDVLTGGEGADILWGKGGQDTFVYANLTEAGDAIVDFAAGVGGDAVDLSTLLTGLGYAGADPFGDGYVRPIQSGADTLVQIDSNGGGDGYVTLATLQGTTESDLTSDNWVL